jgi:hypothetical protein
MIAQELERLGEGERRFAMLLAISNSASRSRFAFTSERAADSGLRAALAVRACSDFGGRSFARPAHSRRRW